MQKIEINLTGKDGASVKSYDEFGRNVTTIICTYANLISNNRVYCFTPKSEDMIRVQLIFADKAAAEEMAKEFNPVPKWLADYELTPGFFYGKPFSVLWDDEK